MNIRDQTIVHTWRNANGVIDPIAFNDLQYLRCTQHISDYGRVEIALEVRSVFSWNDVYRCLCEWYESNGSAPIFSHQKTVRKYNDFLSMHFRNFVNSPPQTHVARCELRPRRVADACEQTALCATDVTFLEARCAALQHDIQCMQVALRDTNARLQESRMMNKEMLAGRR